MIKYIYANNYKSFVNFKLDFRANNLLLGGNGAGKSNLLLLIAWICTVVRDSRRNVGEFFRADSCTRWLDSNIQTFELGIEQGKAEYVYHLEIEHDLENAQSRILTERVLRDKQVFLETQGGEAKLYNEISGQYDKMLCNSMASIIPYILRAKQYKSLNEFKEFINGVIYCVPDPKQMTPVVVNDIYFPEYNLSNLASVYIGLIEMLHDFQYDFTSAMKEINPFYVGANTLLDSFPKSLAVNYQFRDVRSAFRLDELSDGEKVLFALYMLLYGFLKRGCTLLLDEPDNFLSLREIQPWCVELEDILLKSGQCILVSHHPEVIDYFTASSGIWMSRLQSGESVVVDNPYPVHNDGKILAYSEFIARGMDETDEV